MNNSEDKMKSYSNKMFYKCKNYKNYKINLMISEIYLEFIIIRYIKIFKFNGIFIS